MLKPLRSCIFILLSSCLIFPQAFASDELFLLTEQRNAFVMEKYRQNTEDWQDFISRVNLSFSKPPYFAAAYSVAAALAYRVTDEERYLAHSLTLYERVFHQHPKHGWNAYRSRNGFRSGGRWAFLGYNWLKPELNHEQRLRFESNFAIWANYWIEYTDYSNDFSGLRTSDSDDVTSLAENLLLMGLVLKDSIEHQELGERTLMVADKLLNEVVIERYMQDIMAGGVWAEGNDYSSQTQLHWVVPFIINREVRNIELPNNYPELAAQALNHMTLSGFTDVYRYGSGERVSDYTPIGQDGRYQFALALRGLLSQEQTNTWLQPWWNRFMEVEGYPERSIYPGVWQVLFQPIAEQDASSPPATDTPVELPTLFHAPGVGLVAARTDWSDDATNLYMINRRVRLDHEQKDALSIDIAYKGRWVSKELTGYSGVSKTSVAHNTLLIENAEAGSSSPTGRAGGNPFYYSMFDDEEITSIAAEAAPAYNMSGYYATDYAEQVTRQVTFFKPNLIAIYDRVLIDPSQFRDLQRYKKNFTWPPGGQYLRWVKLNQMVENEPLRADDAGHEYRYATDNANVQYGIESPHGLSTEVIDQKVLYADYAEYHAPESQRKWQIQAAPAELRADTEFVSYFFIQDKTSEDSEETVEVDPGGVDICQFLDHPMCEQVTKPEPITSITTSLLTTSNYGIVAGNALGMRFNDEETEQTLLSIWNRTPSVPLDTLIISTKQNAQTKIVVSGLHPERVYEQRVESVNDDRVISWIASQLPPEEAETSPYHVLTNDQGILKFNL